MVGHGVRTAKGGKSGEAKSLFIRQNTGKNHESCPFVCGRESECPAYFIRRICLCIYIPYPLEQGKTGIKILLLNFVCAYIPVNYFAKRDTSCLVFPRARPKHRCRLSFLRQFLRLALCARWRVRLHGREPDRFWGGMGGQYSLLL